MLGNILIHLLQTTSVNVEMDSVLNDEEKIDEIMINDTQKLLLEQQMRQHVQILTQNFILGYQHPEYFEVASKCKEYLVSVIIIIIIINGK